MLALLKLHAISSNNVIVNNNNAVTKYLNNELYIKENFCLPS